MKIFKLLLVGGLATVPALTLSSAALAEVSMITAAKSGGNVGQTDGALSRFALHRDHDITRIYQIAYELDAPHAKAFVVSLSARTGPLANGVLENGRRKK